MIANVAIADVIILFFGIPEIVQFMINKGWLIDSDLCRIDRTILVCALYASVISSVALCIER